MRLETIFRTKNLSRITGQYQQAENVSRKMNMFRQEQIKLNRELNFLNGYLKKDILWSEKLSQLRNLIPQEAWLTELFFKKQFVKDSVSPILYLKGGLIPEGRASSIETLIKFINQLKEDQEFFADFDNLILADSQTETRKNIEIMTFIIEMSLKKDKAKLIK